MMLASGFKRPAPALHSITRASVPSKHLAPLSVRHQSSYQSFQDSELVQYLRSNARSLSQQFHTHRTNLEHRLQNLAQEISRVSGYSNIESLKQAVAHEENALNEARRDAVAAKNAYTTAVEARSASQRETNDLLSRKNSWSGHDVSRFTQLVQEDHTNEQAEKEAKAELNRAEEAVENGLSTLMRAILNRYHEEQVWSDKIRSLSTYGSLGITGANVFLFLLAVVLVEPWRRKRLVDKLEIRMAEREATLLAQNEAGLQRMVDRVDALATHAEQSTSTASSPSPSPQAPPMGAPTLVEVGSTAAEDGQSEVSPASSSQLALMPAEEAAARSTAHPTFDWKSLEYWKDQTEKLDWPSGAAGFAAGFSLALIAAFVGK